MEPSSVMETGEVFYFFFVFLILPLMHKIKCGEVAGLNLALLQPKTVSAESAEDDKTPTVQDFSSYPSTAQQSWSFAGGHTTVSTQPPVVDDAGGGYSFPQQYEGGSASVTGAGSQSSFFTNASQGSDNSSASNNQFFSGDQWYSLSCG
jgi:hypothetical protein